MFCHSHFIQNRVGAFYTISPTVGLTVRTYVLVWGKVDDSMRSLMPTEQLRAPLVPFSSHRTHTHTHTRARARARTHTNTHETSHTTACTHAHKESIQSPEGKGWVSRADLIDAMKEGEVIVTLFSSVADKY